ncbi:MAG: hypothetical protein ABIG28_01545 [archaeon]
MRRVKRDYWKEVSKARLKWLEDKKGELDNNVKIQFLSLGVSML